MRLNVMIPMLLVLSGLAACSRTTSPERYTAVAASRTMANHQLCPDLVGTFRFDGQGAAMRPFLDQAPASHAPTLLTIDGEPNASTYRFRTGVHEALFRNQVADMQRRGNDEYADWRQRVLAHAAAVAKGERSAPMAEAVGELGPVPTHAGVLSRGQCEEHWMRLPDVDPNAYRDVAAGDSVDRSDLELWAARDAEGALLLRFDRYRLSSVWVLGTDLRTTRHQHFIRLMSADAGALAWNLAANLPDPKPPEPVIDLAARAKAVYELNSRVEAMLPESATLDTFEPREAGEPAMRQAEFLTFDIHGSARSNADISQFLRQLTNQPDFSNVELVSIRREDDRMVFDIMVKWREAERAPNFGVR